MPGTLEDDRRQRDVTWHHRDMTEQAERYDRISAGYERWWAPVLRPSTAALLDLLAPSLAAPGAVALDVGAGTGNLTLAALARWPGLRVTAVDVSSEMLAVLAGTADERLADGRARLETRSAPAAELPAADASYDVAMASFVLQLVPNRAKALREIRRVLRPGGRIGHVTWLEDRRPFAPDRIFDELLGEAGYDEEPADARHGDIPSVATAASELRHAGFRAVTAEPGELAYAFSVESYLGFLTEFDEETLFEEMRRSERHRFLARLRERLMALPHDGLTFRAPIVYVTGRRSR